MSTRTILVCADDFAAEERDAAAMLQLAADGRLSAVSCLTDAPAWRRCGKQLLARMPNLYLGVHFNLTLPLGWGEQPLPVWIARAVCGRIDRVAVRAALRRQVAEFADVVGHLPDYIDGHQHVHVLPQIRAVVQEFAATLRHNHPVQVRSVSPPFGRTDAPAKRWLIQRLAAVGVQPHVEPAVRLNTAFSGDYSLQPSAAYPELFADWLASAPDNGLIMCHPGEGRSGSAHGRELKFLRSAQLSERLAEQDVRVGRRTDRFSCGLGLTLQYTGT
jgi:predicted glycoside hydrolase/deacetylase ChbG (UPF0249 family)